MTLRLYNTLTRAKEEFRPARPDRIGIYVCGPTVYDHAHIGNARPVIVFDVLCRLLRHLFEPARKVIYVRNITDVDDKIIAAHEETGEAISQITERTTRAFHRDMAALGNLAPDHEPRATQHIEQMKRLAGLLLERGHAYLAEGHLLFEVSSMADYGKLSGHSRADLIAGARVEVAPYKKDPADFVLWKPSSPEQPGWDSPWGRGRPGWHLECSAMSAEYLGLDFDIHGGGQDLIFPHHENEIAQSRSAHPGARFAHTWMHNGYLTVEGEKMSKSLGNFITVKDLLAEHHGETIRLCMLMTHYRQPLNWTADGLAQAKDTLDKWYGALRGTDGIKSSGQAVPAPLLDPLSDDLNSPLASTALHETAGALNRSGDAAHQAALLAGAGLLGLLAMDPEDWFKWRPPGDGGLAGGGLSDGQIENLIAARARARDEKDFAEADRLRDDLAAQGIQLEDGAGGTTWKRSLV